MKTQVTLLFIFLSLLSYAQSSLNRIIKQARILQLPYSTTQQGEDHYKNNLLSTAETKLILNELKAIKQTVVNPKRGTSFGDLDNPNEGVSDLAFDDVEALRLIGFIKAVQYGLLVLKINYKNNNLPKGILLVLDANGKVTDWLFTDGNVNGGNQNGNISRDLTISADKLIKLEETSWGRNTESYNLKVVYKLNFNPLLKEKPNNTWA